MGRNRRRFLVTCCSSLLFFLGALATPRASEAQDWTWPERAENLQDLPEDFPPERLRAVMTGFTRALGVRCSHCHVGEEGQPLGTYDFPSDDKRNKRTARAMLQMLGSINDQLDEIEPSGERVNMWCHTCHRGRPRPQTLQEAVIEVYRSVGLDAAVAHYRELRDSFYGTSAYDFSEPVLDGLGYQLLEAEKIDEAIAMFRLNAEYNPESAGVYDSLADGYLAAGESELAVVYLRKSLEMKPDNERALAKLRELTS